MSQKQLSHIDDKGKVRMVDVSMKPDSDRGAIAKCHITMGIDTFSLIRDGYSKKGDILTTAQLAGVMAAKRTAELIPLCHPLSINYIHIDLILDENLPGVVVTAEVKSHGQTGVEMEALTAVSVAALTVYDMVKAVDKSMHITNIRLIEKHGGQSGDVQNE